MDINNRSIPDLIAERKALATQLSDINSRLGALDRALFSRLETALAAFGVSAQPSVPELPLPPLPPAIDEAAVALMARLANPVSAPQSSIFTDGAPSGPARTEVGQAITAGTREILLEARHPLKIREIFNRLMARGVEIPGKVPMNNLSAHLSRSSDFVLVSGTRWWFAEKQKAP